MHTLYRLLSRFGALDVFFAWMGIASGLLLILPKSVLDLGEVHSSMHSAMAVSLSLSLAYVLSRLLSFGLHAVYQNHILKDKQRRINDCVAVLDHSERAILREFVLTRRSVLELPLTESSVKNLIRHGVLEAENPSDNLETRGHAKLVIAVMARPVLSFKALGLPVGKLNESQLDHLRALRPMFLRPEYKANRTHNGKVFRIRFNESQNAA
ncbi:hypothetical protein DBZ36_02790 [Alginatibacterium sediminis]|uniref:Superinfection exclusion protein B n=1 Tax=Alginatibacterium sediminis TaxID=2164068 RepID=A0A420EJK5_9ALTE|nr:super-infection exclusion protein B [Alginatibacterium sediminis]RKF20885.1 hypothetical protein DBZ36_02790 [Alginatibacterium sediminis]